jgi:uncharacterized protein YecE (DUF72 family)
MTRPGAVRIGISGWRYKGWRGVFYPEKLAQRRGLEFASRKFNTIELNGSFYSLQRPQSFAQWYQDTPKDFVFSVKGSRYITHMRRLRDVEEPLARFLAQGVLGLAEKLGPLLWQFPPNFRFDAERLNSFFALLPKTHGDAASFVRRHDGLVDHRRLDSGAKSPPNKHTPLRHAIEIRHESFVCEEFIALLRQHRIALVVADTVEWPLLMDTTAGFVYCRLHGSEQLYASGYDDEALDRWAERVSIWARGGEVADGRHAASHSGPREKRRDVFVYFDNDVKVRAPFDAHRLQERVAKLLSA